MGGRGTEGQQFQWNADVEMCINRVEVVGGGQYFVNILALETRDLYG